MSGRLLQVRVVDPVLTQLARGYSNAEAVGSLLFPIVSVKKEAGKIPLFGKESFLIFNTERALRAKSNRLPVEDRDAANFTLTEHDSSYPIDYREMAEDLFDTEAYGAHRTQESIMLRHEKICADLAQDDGNYPSGSKITLTSSGQFTHADSDPIITIENAKEAMRQKIVKRPNTMVIGAQSYKVLKNHPKILERVKYTQLGIVTVDLLKSIFDVPNIKIGEMVYSTDAGVTVDLWGDNIVLAYVPEAKTDIKRSIYEPSFGYTMRHETMPQADKYEEEGGKIEVVRSTDNFVVKIVGADAGYLIKDTNA